MVLLRVTECVSWYRRRDYKNCKRLLVVNDTKCRDNKKICPGLLYAFLINAIKRISTICFKSTIESERRRREYEATNMAYIKPCVHLNVLSNLCGYFSFTSLIVKLKANPLHCVCCTRECLRLECKEPKKHWKLKIIFSFSSSKRLKSYEKSYPINFTNICENMHDWFAPFLVGSFVIRSTIC